MASNTNPKNFLPLKLKGSIVPGYGRGGKQLGFPTANIDPESFRKPLQGLDDEGVYYGLCQVDLPNQKPEVEPMVMCIGRNPHFGNKDKSVEVHILKNYNDNFYGREIKVMALGYIRPMSKYPSLEQLSEAIRHDIDLAKTSLSKSDAVAYKKDPFWSAPSA